MLIGRLLALERWTAAPFIKTYSCFAFFKAQVEPVQLLQVPGLPGCGGKSMKAASISESRWVFLVSTFRDEALCSSSALTLGR